MRFLRHRILVSRILDLEGEGERPERPLPPAKKQSFVPRREAFVPADSCRRKDGASLKSVPCGRIAYRLKWSEKTRAVRCFGKKSACRARIHCTRNEPFAPRKRSSEFDAGQIARGEGNGYGGLTGGLSMGLRQSADFLAGIRHASRSDPCTLRSAFGQFKVE